MPEAVYVQYLMGVEGVIVDFVREITEAVYDMISPTTKKGEKKDMVMDEELNEVEVLKAKPQFSQRELSFLLKLIPELIQ